jgi:hypothetical protein
MRLGSTTEKWPTESPRAFNTLAIPLQTSVARIDLALKVTNIKCVAESFVDRPVVTLDSKLYIHPTPNVLTPALNRATSSGSFGTLQLAQSTARVFSGCSSRLSRARISCTRLKMPFDLPRRASDAAMIVTGQPQKNTRTA